MLAISLWSHYLQPFSLWSLLPNPTKVIYLEHISDNITPLVKPFCFLIGFKLKSWPSNRLASLAHAVLINRSLLTPPHPTIISSLAVRNNFQLLGSPAFSFASGFSHTPFPLSGAPTPISSLPSGLSLQDTFPERSQTILPFNLGYMPYFEALHFP